LKERELKAAARQQIKMLDRAHKDWAASILERIMEQDYAWVFSKPVDPVLLEIPDYFNVILHPMDLGTVRRKLEQNGYGSLKAFAEDVRLTFDNAMAYNRNGCTEVFTLAKDYRLLFELEYNSGLAWTGV
jgi:hypothetical protein